MRNFLFLLVMFSIFYWSNANAQVVNKKVNPTERRRPCFVDENNNKTCDNYEKKSCKRANNANNENLKSNNSCDGTGHSLKQKDENINKKRLADSKKKKH